MKKIFLALCLMGCTIAHANKVDSLRGVWNDAGRPDTVRMTAFRQMIWKGYLFSDPDSARILGDSLYRSAMRKDLKVYAADALIIRGIISMITGKFDSAVVELEKAKVLFVQVGNSDGIAVAENTLGNAYWKKGDLSRAIVMFTNTLRGMEKLGKKDGVATAELNIGLIYDDLEDTLRAIDHFKKALDGFTAVNHADGVGEACMNLGNGYVRQGDTAEALAYLERARAAFESTGNIIYQGQALTSQGQILFEMHRFAEAQTAFEKSAEVLAPMGREGLIGVRLATMEMYRIRGDFRRSVELGEALRPLADSSGTLKDVKTLYFNLYKAYKGIGKAALALQRYERYQDLEDSLVNDANKSGMLRQEYKYTSDKRALSDSLTYAANEAIHVKEIQKQKVIRNGFMGGFALVALFAGVFFLQRNRISKARKRSDELLLNILPAEVAEELKAKGSAKAVQIDQVTVLFTDFKGFTAMSEVLSPQDLVRDLNDCFSAFDHVTEKYGIEKIKTIGDAYMAAGGLPTPNKTHATDVIKAAFEMRDFIAGGKAQKIAAGLPCFEIRIGVHTGPVVAGIVGVKKFSYDIWGDTVNTASRMESSGEVGQVNISEATYALVKDEMGLSFTSRGKVQAKGKGEMEMYFVERATHPVGAAVAAAGG